MLADLAAAGVGFVVHEHSPVFTVEESADVHRQIAGTHSKNLFLKDAKGVFWLVTMPHDRRADLKFIAAQIGAAKLSFARPEHMLRLLGVTPGSVTPLAVINDTGSEVRVVLDAAIDPGGVINVHPLRNSATVSLAFADLVDALTRWDHPPQIVALAAERGA
jgi:Ala-tRNA(Pro) deacylase